jgi:Uma2 family endonuclease
VSELAAFSPLGEPMSWEQYWELSEELRAEYSDGRAFVNPPAVFRHQDICFRLHTAIVRDLPAAVVASAVGWRLVVDPPRLRIPDLMILSETPGDVVSDAPLVAVEVLSTNRNTDLIRKATEYLAAGAGQYWIVDPRDEVIECFAQDNSGWRSFARLTRDEPLATVIVAPLGSVELDLAEVLGPPAA